MPHPQRRQAGSADVRTVGRNGLETRGKNRMERNPLVAGLLSLLVPGLGQIYCGEGNKGAAILVAATIIGSLNIIFLPIFILANPDPGVVWAYWIPRVGHDVVSFWSIVFWIWVILDAYRLAKNGQPRQI